MSNTPNMLNYSVSSGQHIRKENQDSEFPSMASLSDINVSNANAMLDHQTSSSSTASGPVPTNVTPATETTSTAGLVNSNPDASDASSVCAGKLVDNGHTGSNHFFNNNYSNQVILGQGCHNSNGTSSSTPVHSRTDCNLQENENSEITNSVVANTNTLNGNGPLNSTSKNIDVSPNLDESIGSSLPQPSGNVVSNGLPESSERPLPLSEPMNTDDSFPRIVKQEPNVHNTPREDTETPVDIKPSILEPIAGTASVPVTSNTTAEKRTLVIVKIVEQTILNGRVVDEQVRENEFISKGGYTSWPEATVIPSFPLSTCSSSNIAPQTRQPSTPTHQSNRPVQNSSGHRGPGRPPSNKNSSTPRMSTGGRGQLGKRATIRSHNDVTSNDRCKRVKVEVKEEHQSEEERMMRETASTLLALHAESPVKKMDSDTCDSQSDLSETEFQPLHLGSFVLAKWTDKNFYPGHVRSSLGDGRWQIIFEDGGKKVVHESDIISVPHLAVGQVVMATFPDSSICLKGVIRRAFNEKSQLYYDVEYSDGAKMVVDKFSRKDIFLTPDLAASLLSRQSRGSDKASKFADVDLNNIIPKRSRTSTQFRAGEGDGEAFNSNDSNDINSNLSSSNSHTSPTSTTLSSSTPSIATPQTSGTSSASNQRPSKSRGRPPSQNRVGVVSNTSSPKIQAKGRNEANCASTAPTSASSPNSSSTVVSTDCVTETINPSLSVTSITQPAKTPSQASNSSQADAPAVLNKTANIDNVNNNNSPSNNNNCLDTLGNKSDVDTDLLGPIPPFGSTLFRGLAFLLTTADAPTNTESVASSGQGRSTAPFDIPHLVKQIESGGGHVYQTLEEAKSSPESQEILLLAYTYLRTVKYMQCLAVGITCLMHSWVIECCRQNWLVKRDDFLLPSGFSITTKTLITDRQVFKRSANLFKGARFMLVSHNPRHAESWTSVLRAANATIVDDFTTLVNNSGRKGTQSPVDYIISDSSCPANTVKKAAQLKIPIVSSEYVVQCLINGKRLAIDAHEKFSINHRSSS